MNCFRLNHRKLESRVIWLENRNESLRRSYDFVLVTSVISLADYVEISEVFKSSKDLNRYQSGVERLVEIFDQNCGDTWCEGDFGNLTSMSFDCSAERDSRMVTKCVWQFAGSYVKSINPKTGFIAYQKKFVDCKLPINGKIEALLTFFDQLGIGTKKHKAPYGFDAVVPGSKLSLDDVLGECLN